MIDFYLLKNAMAKLGIYDNQFFKVI